MIHRSIFVDLCFYLVIALCGYFSTYNLTGNIVLERLPANGRSVDYPIVISMISIVIVLFVAMPVNYFPFRN